MPRATLLFKVGIYMKYLVSGAVALVVIGALYGFFFGFGGKKMYVTRQSESVQTQESASSQDATSSVPLAVNPLTGESCPDGDKRLLAVMLSGDTNARPISGIAQADIVVEMPVLENGITRFMAAFRCQQPKEIGPIRSARHDFLPFAIAFDSVFSHWGGSHYALDILHTGALDNIDAMVNSSDIFYRKDGRIAPNNGYSSFEKLQQVAERLHYRTDSNEKGYAHIRDEAILNQEQHIAIKYPFPFNVEFVYNPNTNSYARFRGGEKEIDMETGQQVVVKNLIVMKADSLQLEKDYNAMNVQGEGDVTVYDNGEAKKGKWKRMAETYSKERSSQDVKYYFVDSTGRELGLVPGKIWISVIQTNQRVEQIFN